MKWLPASLAEFFYKRNRAGFAQGKTKPQLAKKDGVWSPTWEVARNFVKTLGDTLYVVSEQKVKEAAEEYRKLLLSTLESQRYAARWPPLNPAYLEWKKRNKRDPRMLIATKEYMQSIEVRREEGTNSPELRKVFFIVGLPDRIHRDSGMPVRKLARIHEFGAEIYDKKGRRHVIPPRPLWRPTQKEFKEKYAQEVLDRMKREIFNEITKLIKTFQKAQTDYTKRSTS